MYSELHCVLQNSGKVLTTAEVGCGLVVTDDEASSMFLLENRTHCHSL